jgi:hypothetical protein
MLCVANLLQRLRYGNPVAHWIISVALINHTPRSSIKFPAIDITSPLAGLSPTISAIDQVWNTYPQREIGSTFQRLQTLRYLYEHYWEDDYHWQMIVTVEWKIIDEKESPKMVTQWLTTKDERMFYEAECNSNLEELLRVWNRRSAFITALVKTRKQPELFDHLYDTMEVRA